MDADDDAGSDAPVVPPETEPGPPCNGTPLVPSRPITDVPGILEIVSADFDGDDDDDIATVSDGLIHVLLTQADGSFAVTQHPTFGVFDVLRVADIDGDGDADLLSLDRANDLVRVLINTNGVFAEGEPIATIDDPVKLTVADVDGDGDLDLAVASPTQIAVMFTGGETWKANVGEAPQSVALADIDGDGDRELVVADRSRVVTYRNKGEGFADPVVLTLETFTRIDATVDIDGDGDDDVVTSKGSVSLWRSNGDGTFQQAVKVATGLFDVVQLVDVNGDGHLDLVTTDATEATLEIRDGAGDGTFAAPRAFAGQEGSHLTVGRFDPDAYRDIAFSIYTTGIDVHRGEPGGNVRELQRFVPLEGPLVETRSTAAIDFDLDGDADLATLYVNNRNEYSIAIATNTGGAFAITDTIDLGTGDEYFSPGLTVADIDGDQRPDLVAGNTIARNTSAGWGVFTLGLDALHLGSARTGDLDGDGDIDLVVAGAQGWAVVRNNAGTYAPTAFPDVLRVDALVDVNHDSHLDLLTSTTMTPLAFHLRLGNGDGTFAAPAPLPVEPAAVADLDGDGHLDLVGFVPGPSGSPTAIAYGNGDGTFGDAIPLEGQPSFRSDLRVADFDRDGLRDILTISAAGAVRLFRRDTSGAYRAPLAYGTGGGQTALSLADFDHSGTLDIAMTGNGDYVTLLSQTGCEP